MGSKNDVSILVMMSAQLALSEINKWGALTSLVMMKNYNVRAIVEKARYPH